MNYSEFHFIRPDWFWAVLPLFILVWLLWRQRLVSRGWRAVVDARLLPHLLIADSSVRRNSWPLLLLMLAGLLAIAALAGPTWQKLEQPVFRQQSGLVVLLDLSRSMDAADIRPSRLERARLKLVDILNQRKEGQTALVAYAATPFVVTPLTSDSKTIISQLPSMTTDLMPAQGSRPDRAIAMAQQLLQQAGVAHGSVLLVTDGVEGVAPSQLSDAISALQAAGHRLLVLGVGTATGAPIPMLKVGGFLTDASGAIVIPKLDDASLTAVAQQGGGLYRHMSSDDSDINALLAQVDGDSTTAESKKSSQMMSDQWQEMGVWLLLPLLLLAAFAFRRGYLAAVVLALVILPQPQTANAFEWNSLWSNSDQRGQRALEAGDAAKAAQLFTQPAWRGAAQYRAGDYEKSLESLQQVDNADGHYNRGNALAKTGRLPEAISAYDEALKLDPTMQDAKENRELLKKLLQQQEQQQQDKKNDKNKGDKSQQQPGSQDKSQDGSESQQPSDSDGKQGEEKGKGKESQQQQDDKPGQGKEPQQQSDAGKSDKQSDAKPQSAQQQQATKAEQQPPQKSDQEQSAANQAQQLSPQQSEEQRANEQWLQRIPDDPGGLWRRKFLYQYQRQPQKQGEEEITW